MNPIVISHPELINSKTEIRIVQALFEAGLEIFHLRKPDASERELSDWLEKLPHQYHHNVVIHRKYNLINSFKLKGIHLRHSDKDLTVQSGIHKSISVHSINEYQELDDTFDYAFISPVFNSISKSNYPGKLNEFLQLKNIQKHTLPIALGGINPSNCRQLYNLGFKGIAVLGYIWDSLERITDTQHYVELYRQLLNPCPVE